MEERGFEIQWAMAVEALEFRESRAVGNKEKENAQEGALVS